MAQMSVGRRRRGEGGLRGEANPKTANYLAHLFTLNSTGPALCTFQVYHAFALCSKPKGKDMKRGGRYSESEPIRV